AYYIINAVDLVSSDSTIILSATNGLSPNLIIVSTNSYKDSYKDFNTEQVAGEYTEIIQAYTLSVLDENGNPYTLPTKSYTIKILIAEEYRDRDDFKVVCNYNESMLVVLRATRDGDYLVFTTGMIGEYMIISSMEKDYAIVPIIFASLILIAIIVLYILQCTKFKDKEIRIMSFGGVMLLVYVPLLSKAILISLLMLIIFMVFINAVKFMSMISIDVESLKSKRKPSKKDVSVIDKENTTSEDIESLDKNNSDDTTDKISEEDTISKN
ncbi:MAG: hypothetical protein IJW28_05955, partial [Clostridia bacterium]|nr:hypothetical protein [Clostridia bacterium]